MDKAKIKKIFLIILFFTLSLFLSIKFIYKDKNFKNEQSEIIEKNYTSNLMSEVSFTSKDADGNVYILKALEGEVDFSNNKIIYLKKIEAQVILSNSEDILIVSDFGKYNIENYDTIFSKNVLIEYLDNKISSNYMEFSVKRNLMTISKNVIFSTNNNILRADVAELNIDTKNTKIFMYENSKKVRIMSKN